MVQDAFGRTVPNAPQTGWRITSQQETTELDARNLPVRGYRVYFTTGKDQSGSVFVAQGMYSPGNVQAAVAAAAAQLDAVAGLTG